jgi:hypothetical protein
MALVHAGLQEVENIPVIFGLDMEIYGHSCTLDPRFRGDDKNAGAGFETRPFLVITGLKSSSSPSLRKRDDRFKQDKL